MYHVMQKTSSVFESNAQMMGPCKQMIAPCKQMVAPCKQMVAPCKQMVVLCKQMIALSKQMNSSRTILNFTYFKKKTVSYVKPICLYLIIDVVHTD